MFLFVCLFIRLVFFHLKNGVWNCNVDIVAFGFHNDLMIFWTFRLSIWYFGIELVNVGKMDLKKQQHLVPSQAHTPVVCCQIHIYVSSEDRKYQIMPLLRIFIAWPQMFGQGFKTFDSFWFRPTEPKWILFTLSDVRYVHLKVVFKKYVALDWL